MLLEVNGLYKAFGGVIATKHVSLDVEMGEVHAIIGPNGAGKTTLISQLTGQLRPDGGTVKMEGRRITRMPTYKRARLGMARSFQITSVVNNLTVLENVMLAVQARAGHNFRFWAPALEDRSLVGASCESLEMVGLGEGVDRPASDLSHGEHRQLEIAMATATRPRLLLLDEPMAGMGAEESGRMVEILNTIRGGPGMLLIEHDMDAVFALADRISVLVNGAVIACDTPDRIRNNADVKAAYLGED
ncbi:MAG: ABC transporter ATP-binding protein [Proteobacteria bacterium]|nr:MAG: ABC transporter ATP-binding protein [Pseudomonadota bacterium]